MKTTLLSTIKQLLADRFMASLIVVLLLAGIAYAVFVVLSLQSTDLQVATRYTSFGTTNFYRSKWYYLLSFALLGMLVAGAHAALALKLYTRGQRQLAVFLIAMSLSIIVIAWITAGSVLRIAFL